MFYMHNIGWGWWLLMSLGMVAFWGLVIYGVIWLARGQGVQRDVKAPPDAEAPPPPPEHPEEILKRRLAQGEISVAEYEQLRAALERKPREPAAA